MSSGCPIGGDLIMLHPLRSADQGCLLRLGFHIAFQHFLAFANKSLHPLTGFTTQRDFQIRGDFFDSLQVNTGLF